MKKSKLLDTQSTHEKAFRIKTILGQIPTLSKVSKFIDIPSDRCPRCLREPESNEHLWLCSHTKRNIPKLRTDTITLCTTRKITSLDWKSIINLEPPVTYSRLLDFIGFHDQQAHHGHPFLQSDESKGIITNTMKTRFNAYNIPEIWMRYIIDCWLSSFYELIWKYRNELQFDHPSNGNTTISRKRKRPQTRSPEQNQNKKRFLCVLIRNKPQAPKKQFLHVLIDNRPITQPTVANITPTPPLVIATPNNTTKI